MKKSLTYAVDCARRGGRLLGHVRTPDSVADMDAIRQSLGEQQLNYSGFSYGTYLGQVFATQLSPSDLAELDGRCRPR